MRAGSAAERPTRFPLRDQVNGYDRILGASQANASLDEEFSHNGELMSLRLIYMHMIEEKTPQLRWHTTC